MNARFLRAEVVPPPAVPVAVRLPAIPVIGERRLSHRYARAARLGCGHVARAGYLGVIAGLVELIINALIAVSNRAFAAFLGLAIAVAIVSVVAWIV